MPLIHPVSHVWSIEQVLNLPDAESDLFDRKSARAFERNDWRATFGKALSAFANSGGGHVFIGIEDDGRPTGCPPTGGGAGSRQTFVEWLNNILPGLTDYPLHAFRCHAVEIDAERRAVLGDRLVVAVNIDDSPSAPHQCRADRLYYHRQGGTSVPAPHQIIDLLRNRPVAATLRLDCLRVFGSHVMTDFPEYVRFGFETSAEVVNDSPNCRSDHFELIVEEAQAIEAVVPERAGPIAAVALPGSRVVAAVTLFVRLPNPDYNDLAGMAERLVDTLAGARVAARVASQNFRGARVEIPLSFAVTVDEAARQAVTQAASGRRHPR